MDGRKFLVFGDSHSIIWEGNHKLSRADEPLFRDVIVNHLGAALAWNLMDAECKNPGKWGEKIISQLMEDKPAWNNIAGIMLCFGEIDIRTQIIKRSIAKGVSIDSMANAIAERLLSFSVLLHELIGVPVILWEPIPSASIRFFPSDPAFLAIGSEIERNYATQCFSSRLKSQCVDFQNEGKLIYSLGLTDELMSACQTRTEYLQDGCHLNRKGLLLALEKMKILCEMHGLRFDEFFDAHPLIIREASLSNISGNTSLWLSSKFDGLNQTTRVEGRGYCFHTSLEESPSAIMDIGYSAHIRKIVIFNRLDGYFDRSRLLKILSGNAKNNLSVIHSCDEVWGTDGTPLILNLSAREEPFRYLVFQLPERQYLHLGEIQIYELGYTRH